MVKLTGPGLAKAASGTLAGQLTFSNWKGRAYLKKHRKPKQPRTGGQVGMRAMLAFLSAQWTEISAEDQATWADLAASSSISPFNAYQKVNLGRWRNFQRPSQAHPATEDDQHALITFAVPYPFTRHFGFYFAVNPINDGWAVTIHEVPDSGEPIYWHNFQHAFPIPDTLWDYILITGVKPGLHWYAITTFSKAGKLPPITMYRSCTILE